MITASVQAHRDFLQHLWVPAASIEELFSATNMSPELLAALANVPAGVPPPGTLPNFDNPPSKNQEMIFLNVVFLPLMLIAVAMRLLVKTKFIHQSGWDDSKFFHFRTPTTWHY